LLSGATGFDLVFQPELEDSGEPDEGAAEAIETGHDDLVTLSTACLLAAIDSTQ
jgi:hypothetical protein